jgi:hypothetical protein
MKHYIGFPQEWNYRTVISDIGSDEIDIGAEHVIEVLAFAIYQVIDSGDAKVLHCELADQFRTDESCTAGYHNALLFHETRIPPRLRSD